MTVAKYEAAEAGFQEVVEDLAGTEAAVATEAEEVEAVEAGANRHPAQWYIHVYFFIKKTLSKNPKPCDVNKYIYKNCIFIFIFKIVSLCHAY
jgi:hypothetical protein